VIAAVVALSGDAREVWLPLGDVAVGHGEARRPVAAVEDLITGERHALEWGGLRMRIDPARDPALLLRCVA
jgi:starch synthase (maltosyl-transferring)